ncbi:hypothetical protein [Fictibacillus barbaricus]|uniref:Uncharacterized protein n=1 Tax=Fictibacillus barbaricus TaxID=182136 RepID=A0ABU1TV71_9BACL|nr:hypothetical protein [Fictibacillus barbaricus]MDR7071076.1 hypothetical protein [Fictibacillus barbaricus]
MNLYYLEKMGEAKQLELSKVSMESWKRNGVKKKNSSLYSAFKKFLTFKWMKYSELRKPVCCS